MSAYFYAIWHLVGYFTQGSVKSQYKTEYRIRVKADILFRDVKLIRFHAERVYECESIGWVTRRHIYGSGHFYISPFRPANKDWRKIPGKFTFEDFDVLKSVKVKVPKARGLIG